MLIALQNCLNIYVLQNILENVSLFKYFILALYYTAYIMFTVINCHCLDNCNLKYIFLDFFHLLFPPQWCLPSLCSLLYYLVFRNLEIPEKQKQEGSYLMSFPGSDALFHYKQALLFSLLLNEYACLKTGVVIPLKYSICYFTGHTEIH